MADQLDFNFPESADGTKAPIPALGGSMVIAFDTSTASTNDLATELGVESQWVGLRITTSTDAFITSAASPTALDDGSHHFLSAGFPQDLRFPANHKIALIKSTAAGNAFITLLK